MKSKFVLAAALATAIAACGGGKGPDVPGIKKPITGPTTSTGEAIDVNAQKRLDDAVEAMVGHDKANDWNDATCADVAKRFEGAVAAQPSGKFPEATFDAGLAYQRCGNDDQAKAHFQKALTDDPKFHNSRVQMALYQFKADGNLDTAIASMQQAVLDAQFQNVPALVNLALFQMQRDGSTGADGCKDDMECAKKNLQRALAIDDSYMPAFNQLALFYFQQAKKKAGGTKGKGGRSIVTNAAIGKRADVQQLELASLVCSQAIRKNAQYAPIFNTMGLIQNELGQVNGAVASFKNAATLDARFFEAQMNYAAVNLSFRGFEAAQSAYEKALAMHKDDYDAHLGLALALRGQITDVNYDAQVAKVQAELDTCKKLDPTRPDAFYNEGILTQEYRAKAGGDKNKTITALKDAIKTLTDFQGKATGKTEYDGAVKKAKDRIQDANDTIQFLEIPDAPSAPPPPATPPATADPATTPQPGAGAAGTPAPAPPATPAPAK